MGLEVIIEDPKSHPSCPHGPTLLFGGRKNGRQFYACSACRDKKPCKFFLWADDIKKSSNREAWEQERLKFLKGVNHKKQFILLNKIKSLPSHKRTFCIDCSTFTMENKANHVEHSLISNITDHQLEHPLEILPPLENAKMEAQYLFSKESVKFLVDTFLDLGYKHVICIGAPRIHEYIQSSVKKLSSILLDIDRRFHSFFGPLEFCWYNSFNNHFFFEEAREVFREFLKGTKGIDTVLITDPPFGGRTEALAHTFSTINEQYKKLNKSKIDLAMFWIFPYFMEPHIVNLLPDFCMLDYKVEYDNHKLFQNGPKGRKQGSPVRIFTNVNLSLIKLPEDGYRFCNECNKWVSKENKHCKICRACTSKNGQTYVHCKICQRCVKPNWRHCQSCQRCAQDNHKCGINVVCQKSKKPGHRKQVRAQLKGVNVLPTKKRRGDAIKTKNKKIKS